MIAVLTGWRRYWDAYDIKIIVSINFRDEVLPPYVSFPVCGGLLGRLDVRRTVLGMRVSEHEFLVRADHRQMPMACSGWLRY